MKTCWVDVGRYHGDQAPCRENEGNGDTLTSEHSYLAIAWTTMSEKPSPSNKERFSVLVMSASFANSSTLARFWSAMLSIRLWAACRWKVIRKGRK